MSDKFYVGLDLTSSEDNGKLKPISRVTLWVDDDNCLTSGDDTGRELVADCAHATQAIVDNILDQVKGYQYRSYSAEDANIDPAAELGDAVTVDGMYSVIARMDDDGSGYVSLSAPCEAEMEDEYPSAGPMTQEFNRKLAKTYSLITKTSEQIRLEVADDLNDLSASIDIQLESIVAEVEGLDGRTASLELGLDGISAQVTDNTNSVAALEMYVDSLTLSVSNGSTSSTIKLMAGSAEIASQTINMTGLVTYTGLSGGTTTIDGACIKTGTVAAERLNLTGAITWSDLSKAVQSDIDEAWEMAYDAQSVANDVDDTVSGWVYTGTTYIDGTMLMTGTVMASSIQGGEVLLLDSREREAASFTLTGASSYTGRKLVIDSGAIELNAAYGDIYLEGGDGVYLQLTDDFVVGRGNLIPNYTNRYSCGDSTHLWSDVYAYNDVIVTSDLTKKHDIVYGLERFDGFFDDLKPMSFVFDDNTSGRTHIGLGAQDVEQALYDHGFTTADFAGLIKSPKEDADGNVIEGEYDYALRYGEFISLCIDQIHRLKNRVNELEGKLS